MLEFFRTFITVNGPFAGMVVIFGIMEYFTYSLAQSEEDPVLKYMYAILFIIISAVGIYNLAIGANTYSKTRGFTEHESKNNNSEKANKEIKNAAAESRKMEE